MENEFSTNSNKRFLNRKTALTLFLFALGLSSAVVLGYYGRAVRGGESYHQFYTFPNDKARPTIINYGEDGILHRLISPDTVGGTTGLTNTKRPVMVRMELTNVPDGLEVHWGNSRTKDFNLETRTVERVLEPGHRISVHHTFHISKELQEKPMIYSGSLDIIEVNTDEILLSIPIKIINKKVNSGSEGGRPQ
jgi:hypothetical protein